MARTNGLVCVLLAISLLSLFPQGAEGDSLKEDAMWERLNCSLDSDEVPTTLTDGGDGYLYVGTADGTVPYEASIYRWDGSTCEKWQDTSDYYIYSAVVYNGSMFWGTRETASLLTGNLYTYVFSNGTFGEIAFGIWFDPLYDGYWVQSLYVHDGRLFLTGSIMAKDPPWNNNFFMKYCTNNSGRLCWNVGEWHWVDTNEANIGEIDDGLSMVTYQDELFVGTYDPAIVLRYYNSNTTVWHYLNEQYAQAVHSTYPDGVPDATATQGFYSLEVLDGCLHALSYAWGHNWTLCGLGLNWEYANLSSNSQFARSILWRNTIYHGVKDASSNQNIATFDNFSFEPVFDDEQTPFFLYFEEYGGTLYASNQVNVYRRRTSATPVEITSPNQAETVSNYINLIASVDESSLNAEGCTFLLNSKYYECHKDGNKNIWSYTDLNTRHISNGKYTLQLQVNWSDSTVSKDSIDFFISNSQPTNLDGIEDEYGNIIYLDNAPHKPKWGRTRSEEYDIVVDPYETVIWDVVDTPSAGTSINLYLPYLTGEGSLTVMTDEVFINGQASTDRIWINDTSPTIVVNTTALYYYNLIASGNSNYTIESEATLTVTRVSTIRIVREFDWTMDASTQTWYAMRSFTNEVDSSNTIRNVWFYWSKATGTSIDQETVHVYDNDNNVELDIARHYTVDYGGFQLELDSLAYSSSRSFTLEYQQMSEQASDRILITIYDNDIQPDSSYSEAPWMFTKNVAQPSKDFEGSLIFAFKTITPAKSKPLNKNSIIVEKDGQIIDNWIYEASTKQLILFNEEIDARQSVEYEVFFAFQSPEDVVVNLFVENILFLIVTGLVLFFFPLKPLLNKKEKAWYRTVSMILVALGIVLVAWGIILIV